MFARIGSLTMHLRALGCVGLLVSGSGLTLVHGALSRTNLSIAAVQKNVLLNDDDHDDADDVDDGVDGDIRKCNTRQRQC